MKKQKLINDINEILNKRQQIILRTLVEAYLHHQSEVSSNYLLTFSKIKASSATIRNDLCLLEKHGFTKKLSVTSGRVPTIKAFDYCNQLFSKEYQMPKWSNELIHLFRERLVNNTKTLNDVYEMISEFIHAPITIQNREQNKWQEYVLEEITVLSFDNSRMIKFIVLASHGEIKSFNARLSSNQKFSSIRGCVSYLSNLCKGNKISQIPAICLSQKSKIISDLYNLEYVVQCIVKNIINYQYNRKVYGLNQLVKHFNLADINIVKEIMSFIENNDIWQTIDYVHKQNRQGDIFTWDKSTYKLKPSIIHYRSQKNKNYEVATILPSYTNSKPIHNFLKVFVDEIVVNFNSEKLPQN